MRVAILEDSVPFQILIEHYVQQIHPDADLEFFVESGALLKRIEGFSFDLVVADLNLADTDAEHTIAALEHLMEVDPTEIVIYSVADELASGLLERWQGWVRQVCKFNTDAELLRVLHEIAI